MLLIDQARWQAAVQQVLANRCWASHCPESAAMHRFANRARFASPGFVTDRESTFAERSSRRARACPSLAVTVTE